MARQLDELNGMTSQDLRILREKARITELKAFAAAALTPELRTELQKKTGLPMFMLYNWAKQADLLHCDLLDPDMADRLCQAGLRSLNDLAMADAGALERFLHRVGLLGNCTGSMLMDRIIAAGSQPPTGFVPNAADSGNPAVMSRRTRKGSTADMMQSFGAAYGSDLADVIAELGKGIAQAQRNLDMMSIDVQNEILMDPVLSHSGYNANWYVIPEVDFTLKMEYTFTQSEESGDRQLRMNVVPMNAGYNNLFKSTSERSAESTLNLKFVPVPPPDAFTRRAYMPDLTDMTRREADEILTELGCTAEYVRLSGPPSSGRHSQIVSQYPEEGDPLILGEVVRLELREVEEELFQMREKFAAVMQRHLDRLNSEARSAT